MEITSRNTNTLAPIVYQAIQREGVTETSRNGPVLRFPYPVTIHLTHPWERVNFCPVRDANPFFHLIEAMAMLTPLNDVGLMSHFAKSMKLFSDDGSTYNAFYGTRARVWRGHHGFEYLDQLRRVLEELQQKPDTRQAVVQLWDPQDLFKETKDKACNLCMIFSILNSRLNMTTFNRSNDAILGGVTGANIVHLSFFHEYVAHAVGVPMGQWWHTSNNLHVYTNEPKWALLKCVDAPLDPYTDSGILARLLMDDMRNHYAFDIGVRYLMHGMLNIYHDPTQRLDAIEQQVPFLRTVVVPAFNAWQAWKRKDMRAAFDNANAISAEDWRMACYSWLARRASNPS